MNAMFQPLLKAIGPAPNEPRLWSFVRLFALFAVLTLLHRLRAIALYVDQIEFVRTYRDYEGIQVVRGMILELGPALANGLRSDALFALIAAGLLCLLPRAIRLIAVVGLVIFYAANLEHINYNYTHIDAALIGLGADGTFLLAQLTPILMGYLLIFGALAYWLIKVFARRRVVAAALTIIIAPFALIPFYDFDISQPKWVQTHPLVPFATAANITDDPRTVALTGPAPRMALADAPTTNVLVIYLEGVGHASLQKGKMTTLQRLATEYANYPRYFAHQLITSNGLYSTLTGAYPTFIDTTLRWDEITADDPVAATALPRVLQAAGYQTAFVQAAPLHYMQKDRILPLLGFDTLVGDGDFTEAYSKSGWGVDDRTLFEKVVETIDAQDPGQPWMIATLTTGTHSPYNVPDGFAPDATSPRNRALQYADAAIGHLIDALTARDLLDNTLVVITSDESRETVSGGRVASELALNHLPLIILDPAQTAPEDVAGYRTSSDVVNIVLSRLAATPDPTPDRDTLLMGNVIAGRVVVYDRAASELLTCQASDFACGVFGNVTDLADVSGAQPVKQAFFPALKDQALMLDAGGAE